MARRFPATLRVAPPTLEPDGVLLHQLVELSASSSPAVRTARHAAVRALAGVATVAVIGGTTWVAGAATGPGPGSRHAERPTTSAGVARPGDDGVGTPQSDGTTSAPGSPWSPGLPGTQTTTAHVRHTDAGWADHGRSAASDHPGKAKHEASHPAQHPAPHESHGSRGHGKGHGHAYGHDKTPPGHGPGHPEGDHRSSPGKGHARGHGNGHANGHSHHGGGKKSHQHPKRRGHP